MLISTNFSHALKDIQYHLYYVLIIVVSIRRIFAERVITVDWVEGNILYLPQTSVSWQYSRTL